MKKWELLEKFLVKLGGAGSGHHGHKGVPGQRGGSAPRGGGGAIGHTDVWDSFKGWDVNRKGSIEFVGETGVKVWDDRHKVVGKFDTYERAKEWFDEELSAGRNASSAVPPKERTPLTPVTPNWERMQRKVARTDWSPKASFEGYLSRLNKRTGKQWVVTEQKIGEYPRMKLETEDGDTQRIFFNDGRWRKS